MPMPTPPVAVRRWPLIPRAIVRRAPIDRYLYWSGRRIDQIAADNGLTFDGARHLVLKTPAVAGFQAELDQASRTVTRAKVAGRLERALAGAVVDDLALAELGTARFVRGAGTLVAAEFVGTPARVAATILHTRIQSPNSGRVDVCLFGSMDNLAGFQQADAVPAGWSSSAWYAIEELLASRGKKNTSQWDDEQSRSFEALKIALNQGARGRESEHAGRPHTRGYTLGHTGPAQWLAEIYTDVVLDPDRWTLDGVFEGTERIMIGAPVWVRARQVTRYRGRRRLFAA